MLKGSTVPLSPRGIANLATKPPWRYAGPIVAIEIWTDPPQSSSEQDTDLAAFVSCPAEDCEERGADMGSAM